MQPIHVLAGVLPTIGVNVVAKVYRVLMNNRWFREAVRSLVFPATLSKLALHVRTSSLSIGLPPQNETPQTRAAWSGINGGRAELPVLSRVNQPRVQMNVES